MYDYTNLSFSTVLSEVEKSLEWVIGKASHSYKTQVSCQVEESNLLHILPVNTLKSEEEVSDNYLRVYDKLGLSHLGHPRYTCNGFGSINHAKMSLENGKLYVDVFTISYTASEPDKGSSYLRVTTSDGIVVFTSLLNSHSIHNLDDMIRLCMNL